MKPIAISRLLTRRAASWLRCAMRFSFSASNLASTSFPWAKSAAAAWTLGGGGIERRPELNLQLLHLCRELALLLSVIAPHQPRTRRRRLRLALPPVGPPFGHRRRQLRPRQPRARRRQQPLLPRRLLPLLLPRGEAARYLAVHHAPGRQLAQVLHPLLTLRRHLRLKGPLVLLRSRARILRLSAGYPLELAPRRLELRSRSAALLLQRLRCLGQPRSRLQPRSRHRGAHLASEIGERGLVTGASFEGDFPPLVQLSLPPLAHPQRHCRRQGWPCQPCARRRQQPLLPRRLRPLCVPGARCASPSPPPTSPLAQGRAPPPPHAPQPTDLASRGRAAGRARARQPRPGHRAPRSRCGACVRAPIWRGSARRDPGAISTAPRRATHPSNVPPPPPARAASAAPSPHQASESW
eukprot:scaffold116594_cov57-Phaeocystis_antarctica.AAC.4